MPYRICRHDEFAFKRDDVILVRIERLRYVIMLVNNNNYHVTIPCSICGPAELLVVESSLDPKQLSSKT